MVTVNGQKMRLAAFLSWTDERQDEVLKNTDYNKELKADCKAKNIMFAERLRNFAQHTNSTLILQYGRSSVRPLAFRFTTFEGIDIEENYSFSNMTKENREHFITQRNIFKKRVAKRVRNFFGIDIRHNIEISLDRRLTFHVLED